MVPPTFNDINKSVKDLFNKGYAHGTLKIDSTTQTGTNKSVEFKTGANHNLSTQKLAGNLEVKYKAPQHGLVLTEKWNTENTLGTVIEIKDQFAKGLKVTLDSSYVPHTAKRSGLLKTEWSGDLLKVNADLTLHGGPQLTIAGVVSRNNWLFGALSKFDISSNELKTTSVAFGHQTSDYTIHSYTNDGREFGASWFHKVHKNLELGAQLGWTVGDQNTKFGIASKYRVNDELIVRGKVDNKSQVALSATHDLSDAVKLTLSTQFGLLNVSETTNRFGLGIEYTPK